MEIRRDLGIDAATLARYDINAPRYTSYPPATQFDDRVGESDYIRALDGRPADQPLSLYVHLPFCRMPCFYCGCLKVITRDRTRADNYLSWLSKEMALQARHVPHSRKVHQLHLGGGTPNFLSVAQMERLMSELCWHFRLDTSESREFSIEIDPRFVEEGYMEALAGLGFNRLSVGIQDFDPAVQRTINREQSLAQTRDVMLAARQHGFKSISVDLIYGLPKQSLEGFSETLMAVAALRPDRVAIYGYAHLPALFKPQNKIREEDLPKNADKLALLHLAIWLLQRQGYEYLGMDHFALPSDTLESARRAGTLHRNFQGYSTHAGCDLIGIGLGAIGRVGNVYAQNARDMGVYERALDEGRLPVIRGFELGEDDLLRADIIQSIMCRGEIDARQIQARYGIDFWAYFQSALARLRTLAADGLVRLDGSTIKATTKGRFLLRIIAQAFDAYAPPSPTAQQQRFSRAI